jgi:hypothetical protein
MQHDSSMQPASGWVAALDDGAGEQLSLVRASSGSSSSLSSVTPFPPAMPRLKLDIDAQGAHEQILSLTFEYADLLKQLGREASRETTPLRLCSAQS